MWSITESAVICADTISWPITPPLLSVVVVLARRLLSVQTPTGAKTHRADKYDGRNGALAMTTRHRHSFVRLCATCRFSSRSATSPRNHPQENNSRRANLWSCRYRGRGSSISVAHHGRARTRNGYVGNASTTPTSKRLSITASTPCWPRLRRGIASINRSWWWPPRHGSLTRSIGWAACAVSPRLPAWRPSGRLSPTLLTKPPTYQVLKLDVQFSSQMSNACPIGHARETNSVARLSRPQARDVHWTGAGASETTSEPRVPLG